MIGWFLVLRQNPWNVGGGENAAKDVGSKYIKGLGDAIGSIHGTVDMFSLGALPNGKFTKKISFHLF